jgi:small subunit ribosomal protein S6
VSRDYELGFILNPEVSEDEIRTLLGRIEQIVANYGGQIFKINHWGRRRLAYPIERHRDGYYIFIDMILTPETVAEIERTLRVSELVFRYMMKRRDPKAVQKEREARAAAAVAAVAQAEAASHQPEAPATPVGAENQSEIPAAPVQAEVNGQSEVPAAPVGTENQPKAPVAPVQAESQPEETPIEVKPETEQVATFPVAEESIAPSRAEIESAPSAIEIANPETVEA